jgi:hypothetical protein
MAYPLPAIVDQDIAELARLRTSAQLEHEELVTLRRRREAALRAALWTGSREEVAESRRRLARDESETTWYWLTAAHYDRCFREGALTRAAHHTREVQLHGALACGESATRESLEAAQRRSAQRLSGLLSHAVERAPRRRELIADLQPALARASAPARPPSGGAVALIVLIALVGSVFTPLPWVLLMLLFVNPWLFVVALYCSMWAVFAAAKWLSAKPAPRTRRGSFPWDEKFAASR